MVETPPRDEVTRLLAEIRDGGGEPALQRLVPLVYEELKALARRHMRSERSGHTLPATALVHEAYLRLIEQKDQSWENRAHFLSVASRVIRRVLVDHARARAAEKRGGGRARVDAERASVAVEENTFELIALDESLRKLEQLDARQCRVVELRFFGGMTVEETSRLLGTSPATVKRDWELARAFLHRELEAG